MIHRDILFAYLLTNQIDWRCEILKKKSFSNYLLYIKP